MHVLLGLNEHEYPAVNAGVHALAVTVLWASDELDIIHALHYDFQRYSVLLGDPL